jgi:hypothetical protein
LDKAPAFVRLEVALDGHWSSQRLRGCAVFEGVFKEEHGAERVNRRAEEREFCDVDGGSSGDSYGAVGGAEVDSDVAAQGFYCRGFGASHWRLQVAGCSERWIGWLTT